MLLGRKFLWALLALTLAGPSYAEHASGESGSADSSSNASDSSSSTDGADASGAAQSDEAGGEEDPNDMDGDGEVTEQEKNQRETLDKAGEVTEDTDKLVEALGDGKFSIEDAEKIAEKLEATKQSLIDQFGKGDPRIKEALEKIEAQQGIILANTARNETILSEPVPQTFDTPQPGAIAETPVTPPTIPESVVADTGLSQSVIETTTHTRTPVVSQPTTSLQPIASNAANGNSGSANTGTNNYANDSSTNYGGTTSSYNSGPPPIYRPSGGNPTASTNSFENGTFSSSTSVFENLGSGSSAATPPVVSTRSAPPSSSSTATSTPPGGTSAGPASPSAQSVAIAAPNPVAPSAPTSGVSQPTGAGLTPSPSGQPGPSTPPQGDRLVGGSPTPGGTSLPSSIGTGGSELQQNSYEKVSSTGRIRVESPSYTKGSGVGAVAIAPTSPSSPANEPSPSQELSDVGPATAVAALQKRSRGAVTVEYGSTLSLVTASMETDLDMDLHENKNAPGPQNEEAETGALTLVVQTGSRFAPSAERTLDFEAHAYNPPSIRLDGDRTPAAATTTPAARPSPSTGSWIDAIERDVRNGTRAQEQSRLSPVTL